jgi:hypothetical protein
MSKGWKSQQELNAAKEKTMSDILKNVKFAELSGSEKQVNWANSIREKEVTKMIETFALHKINEDTTPRSEKLFEDCLKIAQEITDAKIWIDDRFAVPGMLARKAGY